MEGVIKGLIHVALGDGDGADEGPRNHSPPPEEERSRSTWAEVVSSGQHGEAEEQPGRGSGYGPSAWGSRKESDGDWEVAGNNKTHHVSYGRTQLENAREEEQSGYGYETSPWSSGKQDNAEEEPESRFGNQASAWSSRKDGGEKRNDGDWEVAGSKKHQGLHRRPQSVPAGTFDRYKCPPSEQEYHDGAYDHVDIKPKREEIGDLAKACYRLWELDVNRLVPGKDYEIDCGEGKKVYQKGDMAPGPLFTWLGDDIFRRPTYSRFYALLDNYNPSEGCQEVVTSEKRNEQTAFIEEISMTAPIKYLFKYLVSKGIVSDNYEEFRRLMTRLWFDLYGRGGGSSSSSAFEHVFVGEIKGRENEVSGFHNWIQFYLEEAKGRVDYQGYILPKRHGQFPDSETQLLAIQFEWNDVLKSVSSVLIGVSPEFEVALYTLCFFVGEEDNHVHLGPYPVNIKCYRLGRDKIGSAFPIAEY